MWLLAARAPPRVRPDFTATIGLVRPILRAMREKRRGWPKRLHVEHDDVRRRVALPVEEKVVWR